MKNLRIGIVALAFVAAFSARAAEPESPSAEPPMLDFGRPCENPQPEFDAKNPVDRMTRKAPRSNPATPLTAADYPKAARMQGAEGTVIMELLINSQGEVSQARVARSSGWPLLDNAALEGVRNWRLKPGTANGEPQCMWGKFASSFRLDEYTDNELAAASVSEQAQRLAAVFLGADAMEDALAEEGDMTAQERAIAKLVNESFREQDVWLKARRRVAAMIAIEFSPEEIEELSVFYAGPVARKMRRLQWRLDHAIGAEGRIAVGAMFCAGAEVFEALKGADATSVFEGDDLRADYAQRVRAFMADASSYCACVARHEDDRRRGFLVGDGPVCGSKPKMP
jgi:TonB family protein